MEMIQSEIGGNDDVTAAQRRHVIDSACVAVLQRALFLQVAVVDDDDAFKAVEC